ncbi:MAG: twin-arginine translocase TatA/TatE family subunit [Gemmatimonadota bacterium]|nr:twin-arginine translocase TatA/TatE family subunit [Gemmatimonadota bacterium]
MSQPEPTLALVTFGVMEMVLLFGILVMLFGAKKLPGLARGIGSGIRNFKGELEAPKSEEDETSEADSEADKT